MTLDDLLGSWEFSMRHVQLAEPVSGRQSFARVLEGAYVQLDWTYDHEDFPDALALLDDRSMHYFDVRGVQRTLTLTFTGSGWETFRAGDDFWQRSAVSLVHAGEMRGPGEMSHDEGLTWDHDYEIVLTRVG